MPDLEPRRLQLVKRGSRSRSGYGSSDVLFHNAALFGFIAFTEVTGPRIARIPCLQSKRRIES